MAVSVTDRFSIYRWSADSDPFTRTQLDASHENIEAYAAKMIRGTGAPSATGAAYKHTFYLDTTTNKVYYFDGTSSGSWHILDTDVIHDSLADAKGDMIVASADNTWAKLSVGTEAQVLTVTDGAGTVGWAAPAVQTPAGTVSSTIASTAPSGWLFLEGQSILNANSTYPSLWAVAPAAWKSSTTLTLPDWRGYYMASYKASDAQFGTLGSTVTGARTIASSHLPTHTHAIDHSHSSGTTGTSDISHTHTIGHGHTASSGNASSDHSHSISHSHSASTDYQGSHGHYIQGGTAQPAFGFVRRLNTYSGGFVAAIDSNNDGVADGLTAGGSMAVDVVYGVDSNGSHAHSVSASHSGNSGFQSATLSHTVTVDSHSGNSGSMSANGTTHTHSFTTPSFTGSSGNGGFANGAYVMPAGVINWMIKAH